ncbi:hypothetical protein SKAU_G00038480 [Synaphobranchus kaupii]|uniref:Uncharacterized protein n=1 Tax=Synaphobranchus kaupii TaxID=118154 RepID=A0A9Q1JGA5_SYNKA|nr:hypothetical protein SKAU_G00038480 [Synaphobranchus kaupii]
MWQGRVERPQFESILYDVGAQGLSERSFHLCAAERREAPFPSGPLIEGDRTVKFCTADELAPESVAKTDRFARRRASGEAAAVYFHALMRELLFILLALIKKTCAVVLENPSARF